MTRDLTYLAVSSDGHGVCVGVWYVRDDIYKNIYDAAGDLDKQNLG